ncbi:MAG TPA: hypothetical protein VFS23_41410 [Vicinamibacterales bacterium]|nr:hypothetical protein [Vicinamibacterales bacterium]
MTEWIDFSVYAAMIIAYWCVSASWARAMTLQMVADRNEGWLAENGERAAALLRGRWMVGSAWFRWACYAWGAISLAVLLARQLGAWPAPIAPPTAGGRQWEALKDAHATLLLIGLICYFAVIVVSTRLIQRDVPLAERRRASLTPRTIHDFVPRWFSLGAYLLVGIHLAAWVVVGVLGLSSSPDFWIRFAAPVAFSAIVLFIAHATVDRRFSDFVGMHDRRLGVRFAFASLIYVQFMFGLRLYGEIAGPSFEVDRFLHLSLSFMLVFAMLALMIVPKREPHLASTPL